MLRNDLQKIMFLDIETVPQNSDFSELSDELAHIWEEKFALIHKRMPEKYSNETTAAEAFNSSAGIYSEFGKTASIQLIFITIQYIFPELLHPELKVLLHSGT